MKKPIELGRCVKDNITGFTGIAVEKRLYLNDAPLVLVCSEKLKDGRQLVESFDESRLSYSDGEGKVKGFKEEK